MSAESREKGPLAVIGGTSLLESSLFSSLEQVVVSTEHGSAAVYVGALESGRNVVFLQRHHADADPDHYRPPHLIHHRRSFAALQSLGVSRIVAICSVGALSAELQPGTMILPDDYFYLFGPPVSFYDDKRGHIVPQIHLEWRSKILSVLRNAEIPGLSPEGATYVQTTGPRFETRAEVRFLSTLGEVIGMTAASEATMAAELHIPYAIVAMVDNLANGVAHQTFTSEQFLQSVKENQTVVELAVARLMDKLT